MVASDLRWDWAGSGITIDCVRWNAGEVVFVFFFPSDVGFNVAW